MRLLVCIKDNRYRYQIMQMIQMIDFREKIDIEAYATLPSGQRKYDIAILDLRINAPIVFSLGIKLYQDNQCLNLYLADDYTYTHEFFETQGFHYFLNQEDDLLMKELHRAYQCYLDIHCLVTVKTKNHDKTFYPYEIQYIEEYRYKLKVVVGNKEYEGHIDHYDMIKIQLKRHHFIQIHSHYYVNAVYIMEYKSHEIRMENMDYLPTTLRNSDIIKATIGAF